MPFSIHLSLHANETSRRCRWQLPATHDYERWSDALGHDGSATVIQPAIAPLYDSRSAHELLALLAADDERDGHALLRRHWQASSAAPRSDFDAFWRDSLRNGVVQGSAGAALTLPTARVPAPVATGALPSGELAAVFVPDSSVGDGRFADNGWLQELPRPFTKLTWDNALHLGPATAATLALTTGDIVRATASGRAVDAPVWVQTGHAEGAATLPLGYGRVDAGSVGAGVGFDAYRLRADGGGSVAIRIEKTGRRHDFAVTQHELDQHGRRLARIVAPGERIAQEDTRPASLYPAVAYPTHAWGMVIDLDACIGCNACTIACQAENNIPVVGARRGRPRPRDALDPRRPLRRGAESRQHVPARPVHALRERAVRSGLPGRCHRPRQRRAQRHGLQPLHRHALLLQQLPLQGAPLQLPAVCRVDTETLKADAIRKSPCASAA